SPKPPANARDHHDRSAGDGIVTRIRQPSFGALAMWRQLSGSAIIFPALLQVESVASPSETVNANFAQPIVSDGRLQAGCSDSVRKPASKEA
ncbi:MULTISPECIES: hypothetical protein, partial [Sinorhizobium]|uniref:hypothetical protein n=1 Tax=Sinorhizobium TaxID=28105 RepID=UPI001AEC98D6